MHVKDNKHFMKQSFFCPSMQLNLNSPTNVTSGSEHRPSVGTAGGEGVRVLACREVPWPLGHRTVTDTFVGSLGTSRKNILELSSTCL